MLSTKNRLKMRQIYRKGFTLIELLIVVAIMGVLAAAVLIALDPAAKINLAKDSTIKSDIGQLVNSISAYNVVNSAYPISLAALVTAGELKSTPKQQAGTVAAACTDSIGAKTAGGDYCFNGTATTAIIWTRLFTTTTGGVAQYYCWDATNSVYKTTVTAPTAAATACP